MVSALTHCRPLKPDNVLGVSLSLFQHFPSQSRFSWATALKSVGESLTEGLAMITGKQVVQIITGL